jgi:hypothetical protein
MSRDGAAVSAYVFFVDKGMTSRNIFIQYNTYNKTN